MIFSPVQNKNEEVILPIWVNFVVIVGKKKLNTLFWVVRKILLLFFFYMFIFCGFLKSDYHLGISRLKERE